MKSYERILLIARAGGGASPAMRQAMWLAHRSGAALHVLLPLHSMALDVVDRLRQAGSGTVRDGLLREHRDALRTALSGYAELQVATTVEVIWTDVPGEEIRTHVIESHSDLVVKDVELPHGLRRILTTPLDRELLRSCPVPVLLVHSGRMTPRRIVVAVDVMAPDAAAQTMRQALALAYAADAELHLAYAALPMSALDASGAVVPSMTAEIYETLCQVHQDRFKSFADAHGIAPARRHFRIGPTASAIVDCAETLHADAIVLGSNDRHRFERLLLGSTAEALIGEASCDLLVVTAEARHHDTTPRRDLTVDAP
ncbi:universal stress protein [Solimonas marina]|uniref:Universal stress protein n=1 Tax=Solimonas marina TaxID=2714601 RepID=A0A969WBJ0_9GAMM|nr:universal stress protein [Solimonas marina]NKF23518.1 universal stress protein [Solimonas marina]